MNLGLGLGLGSGRQGGGSAPSLSAQVQALLDGTTGFALDPTDTATMWQDSAKTVPVTAPSDPVGCLRTKWGVAQFDLIQATAGSRPAWDGTRFLVPDGADFLSYNGAMDAIRNAAAYYVAIRHGGTHNNNAFFSLSTATAGTYRFLFSNNTGGANVNRRRLDADGASSNNTASSTVMTGSTVAFMQDLATDGVCEVYRDNVFVENLPAISGTPANGSDTASARLVLFANMNQSFPATGSMGRGVILPFEPTAPQRDLIEAWLTEV